MRPSKLISIVIPAHNEQDNVAVIHSEIRARLEAYPAEIIFVDDGSHDDTAATVRSLQAVDPLIRLIRLSRNFGHQAALLAGIQAATGAAVITMDCDLQHPPELLSKMLEAWNSGSLVVQMVRRDTLGATWIKKKTSALFYRLLQSLSETPVVPGAADFQLLDRKVVEALGRFKDRKPFLRGLVSWLGFSAQQIEYVAEKRYSGSSSYSFSRMVRLSIDAITGLSARPLRLAFFLGTWTAIIALIYAGYAFVTYFRGNVVPGWTSIVMTMLFLGAVQLFSLGILGEYVARIYSQTRQVPPFIVVEDTGFEGWEKHEVIETFVRNREGVIESNSNTRVGASSRQDAEERCPNPPSAASASVVAS
jgi:glycosyltransferase involved in cell wall biosynthesis